MPINRERIIEGVYLTGMVIGLLGLFLSPTHELQLGSALFATGCAAGASIVGAPSAHDSLNKILSSFKK